MGHDDLFEKQSHRSINSQYDEHGHAINHLYINKGHHSYQGYEKSYNLSSILDKIKNNRKLKILIGVLGAILLTIIIVLAIILIPLIIRLVSFISHNGIQGIVDSIIGLLYKIWKGVGK